MEVAVRLDIEPRTIEPPRDLMAALVEAGVDKAFRGSAPSMQKELVRQVEDAKKAETRQRRIRKIVERLSAGR